MQTLRTSDERLKYAFDATQDGLLDWNIKTGDVYYSPQWARLLGYTPGEFEHRVEFFYSILHPDDQTRTTKMLEEHLSGVTQIKQGEIRLSTESGEYRWFLDRGKVATLDIGG